MSEQSQEVRRQVDPIFKQVLIEELTPFTKTLQTEVEGSINDGWHFNIDFT